MSEQLYVVNDIYGCLQGEGSMVGQAMALVRLQGCGVGCPFCDTKESWRFDVLHSVPTIAEALGTNPRWCLATPHEVVAHLRRTLPQMPWALLTGGEPAEQPLTPLVTAIKGAGYRVALETSGTATGHCGAGFDWVCVSPKVGMPGGKALVAEAFAGADELKFVVGKPSDLGVLDGVLDSYRVLMKPDAPVLLQPVWGSVRAAELCVETATVRGWRVSYQVHKFVGSR